ncbi:MAG TPA: four helix bundle protein [Balneolales bacterium]|nr:four helix bundle protein [Balneolales bacterium]
MKKQNIIREKSFAFAVKIVLFCREFRSTGEFELAKQLLKSGTSIGANIEEATAGQTRKDFVSKLAIASKEARETRYWLLLIKEANIFNKDLTNYIADAEELIRLLTAIVKTATGANS